jgi:hypothetical protein
MNNKTLKKKLEKEKKHICISNIAIMVGIEEN